MANKGVSIIGAGGSGTGSDDCSATIANLLQYLPNTTEPCTAIVNGSDDEAVQGTIPQKVKTDIKVTTVGEASKVVVPAGYFHTDIDLDIAVAVGTLGKPSLTKENDATNHISTITSKSKVSKAGYLTQGEGLLASITTVTAKEVTSGDYPITKSGSHDVINYATASVATGKANPIATKSAVSNHTITVTPSDTPTAGYITNSKITGTAVTVSASEVVSGQAYCMPTASDQTPDVTNYATVKVPKVSLASASASTSLNATCYVKAQSTNSSSKTVDIVSKTLTLGGDSAANILTEACIEIKDGSTAIARVLGTMPNNGAVTKTITSQGGTYTIPAGYHNGSGVITASIPVFTW